MNFPLSTNQMTDIIIVVFKINVPVSINGQ
jgi:hypothetical protein